MWLGLFTLLSWVHLQLVEPLVRWWEEVVLGSWEEWLLALVRQGFEETTRFLNGIGAWFLSLFSKRSYREQLRRAWQENSWQRWWGEVATRPSTLNALVATLVAQQQEHTGVMGEVSPAGTSSISPPQAGDPNGAAVQLNASRAAWWQRPIRDGVDSMGRLKQKGALLSARLDRPVVFVQQSGMGILDELAKRRHGLIEDAKMASQLAVSRCFDLARTTVRAVFFLPTRESLSAGGYFGRRNAGLSDGSTAASSDSTEQFCSAADRNWKRSAMPGSSGLNGGSTPRGPYKAHLPRSKSAHVSMAERAYQAGAGSGSASASISRRGLQRSRSYGRLRTGASTFSHHTTEAPSDALSVIRDAGYPHELHTVTTDDGYVLRMERIPRPGAGDVVFFMHGVLDTSMAWVSGGVTGSQAFAAWEAGMDVWLGNSRGNAPRQHQDPSRRGWRYWQYNINHMGMYDIAAQLDHIHNVKCAELGAGTVTLDLDHLGPLAGSLFGRHGSSVVRKRISGNPNPGAELQLLPGRGCSTGASHVTQAGVGRQEMHSCPTSSKLTARMRQSNSDSNLYRWGSSNSASSIGRVAPAYVAALTGGTTGADGSPSEAASTLIAPATPKQASPQQQYLATTEGALSSLVSAASLGREASCNGLLSAMKSCEVREGEGLGPRDAAEVAVGAELCCRSKQADRRLEARGLEPSGAIADGLDAVDEAGEKVGRGRRRLAAGLSTDGADPTAACCPASASSAPSAALQLRPMPSVCQNAVTLTVMASSTEGPTGASASPLSSGGPAAQAPFAVTTFTLAAKTRRDFGPGVSATGLQAATIKGGFSSRQSATLGTLLEKTQVAGGSVSTSQDVSGLSGGAGAAASVLEVVNSVFGPAADAVTHAMASAGAAIATAAVSATHLLQHTPSSFIPGAMAPAVSAHQLLAATSPFAAPASQSFAVSQHAAPDAGGQGTEPSPFAAQDSPLLAAWTAAPSPAYAPDVQARPPAEGGIADVPQLSLTSNGSISSTVEGLMAEKQETDAAAAAAASALGTSCMVRRHRSPRHGSKSQLMGPSFRRACSSEHLAAVAGCVVGNAPNSSGDVSERISERCSSIFSTASGRTPTSGVLTTAGNGAAWAGNFEHVRAGTGTAAGCPSGAVAGASDAAYRAPCPYKLRCVAHSLGGMSVLIHLINRLREGRPHHVSRVMLLTPAGFHKHCPRSARPIMWALPIVTRLLRTVLGRSFCFPLYIPTPLGRALTFKLLLSASRIPGLGELLRLGFKALMDGDISQWDRALQMPHYSAEDMPAISVDQVLHLIQLVNTGEFRLYDYGSPAANAAHYGRSTPPDVSSEYWRLDLPVHLVGGRRDGVIPVLNLYRHLEAMKAQGVAVSYREFDFGHLDFTFGVKEELRMYLMKVLRL